MYYISPTAFLSLQCDLPVLKFSNCCCCSPQSSFESVDSRTGADIKSAEGDMERG